MRRVTGSGASRAYLCPGASRTSRRARPTWWPGRRTAWVGPRQTAGTGTRRAGRRANGGTPPAPTAEDPQVPVGTFASGEARGPGSRWTRVGRTAGRRRGARLRRPGGPERCHLSGALGAPDRAAGPQRGGKDHADPHPPVLTADGGEVWLDGRRLEDVHDRHAWGYMPQEARPVPGDFGRGPAGALRQAARALARAGHPARQGAARGAGSR